MAFYLEHSHRHPGGKPGKVTTRKASPLEIAAEEFLNGLLCHYEPPQKPYRSDDDMDVDYQNPLELRRPPSILKKSSSFESRGRNKKNRSRSVRFAGISMGRPRSHKEGHHHKPKFLKKLACRKGLF